MAPRESTRYVALLRGINLGGRRIPMPALAAMFSDAGCHDVRTYIASGNVVFSATPALAGRIPRVIPAAIAETYHFDAPVIVRSADEMHGVTLHNPFLERGCDPAWLHVVFLADMPAPPAVAALDPHRSPPDEFVLRGGEIYLYLPNGAARSKLTNAYFDAKLKTISSGRNWRTVTTLLQMMRA
jgi:uncharacterized protein (DUF1697 family)